MECKLFLWERSPFWFLLHSIFVDRSLPCVVPILTMKNLLTLVKYVLLFVSYNGLTSNVPVSYSVSTRSVWIPCFGINCVCVPRSPSPEPIYNNEGKRLNTREYRTRKKLEEDRHRLVQEAMVLNAEYKPPPDYKWVLVYVCRANIRLHPQMLLTLV